MNAEEGSDERLMEAIRQGDHHAFSLLVRRHSQRFYKTAWRMCGRESEAEDIVQEAFLKLWEKPDVWKPGKGARFTTWFYRIVVNKALDRRRREKKYAGPEIMELTADPSSGPEDKAGLSQEQRMLEEAIRNLPHRQKAALNPCVYEGLSNREAAEVLNVRLKALESLLMRAKSGIRDYLAGKGYDAA